MVNNVSREALNALTIDGFNAYLFNYYGNMRQ